MKNRPTILDVARQAGVSKSTVSLVLQGNSAVKEATRVTVRKAMADIGYVYNRSAATLRSSSSGLIGLVINDLRNPFFTEFAALFQMELARNGYATVLAHSNEDPRLQVQMISSLVEHGVSGIIISPSYGDKGDALAILEAANTPTMQVFRTLSADKPHFPFVAPDYELGGRLATEHLREMGCKRIAFFGGLEGRPVTAERMRGYLDVMSDLGLEPIVLTGQATRAFGRNAAKEMRIKHPDIDGVLCFNDLVGLGVLSACQETGIGAGTDLMVVGFDDIEECRDSNPPMTSISCKIPDFAHSIATQILTWIKNGSKPEAVARSPVRLIKRASSGAL